MMRAQALYCGLIDDVLPRESYDTMGFAIRIRTVAAIGMGTPESK